ncbi:MAG: DUF721 domain-containing protein [Xanthomonadales bacterium]|nr:DUF721 domain-containing protein [Xanthomonadales bacterium]
MNSGPKSKAGRPRPLSGLLKPAGGTLGKLVGEARRIQALEQRLHRLLEPAMASRVRVAGIRRDCLVLVTPSAAIAARLRMDSQSLLSALSRPGKAVAGQLQVKVAPLPVDTTESRQRRSLPDSARKCLQRFAEDTGDASLQQRLERKTKEQESG